MYCLPKIRAVEVKTAIQAARTTGGSGPTNQTNRMIPAMLTIRDSFLPRRIVAELIIDESNVIFDPDRTTKCMRPTSLSCSLKVVVVFRSMPNKIPFKRDA
jgi:hypothetical protein